MIVLLEYFDLLVKILQNFTYYAGIMLNAFKYLMIHIVDNDNVATYGNCVNYDHYDNALKYSGQLK